MGVKGFSSLIYSIFGDSISLNQTKADILLIDCNYIFYQLGDFVFSNLDQKYHTKKYIFNIICSKLQKLIYDISPEKAVYLAIDGVPGYCKQIINRKYHFKSFFYPLKKWNSELLSVGTSFNFDLCQYIINFFKENKIYINNNFINIFVSDSSIPGEGEHKIKEFIRTDNIYKSYIIYSPDSDIFILSLFLQKNKLFLFNPSIVDLKNNKPYTICDLNKLKEEWIKFFHPISYYLPLYSNTILTNNIVALHFFGNDFLPSVPSIAISTSIVQFVCQCNLEPIENNSKKTYNVTNIIEEHNNTFHFNQKTLLSFLWRLSKSESFLFLEKYKNKRKTYLIYDNLIEQSIKDNYFDIKFFRDQYYIQTFGNIDKSFINKLCEEYIKGILFVTNYYLKTIPTYDWYYPYSYAPLFTDLYEYIKEQSSLKYEFEFNDAMSTEECLASTLHPINFSLLPPSIEERLEREAIIHYYYFPDSLNIDNSEQNNNCKKNINIPMIPYNLVRQWCKI
jgi:5'-3' exoribonuclease 2